MTLELRVFDDAAALAHDVAESFRDYAQHWLNAHDGDFHVALTGGRTGGSTLAEIRSLCAGSLDWSRVQVWWGDERWLPAADAERNEVQADEALLRWISIPAANVHRCASSDSGLTLDEAAAAYAAELAKHAAESASAPEFALVFLGMGPDGHIASLFPEHPALEARIGSTVVAVRNSPKPPAERLSLTMSTINAAAQVWVMLSGADKAEALQRALEGDSAAHTPASALGAAEATLFFVDEAAARNVLND